MRVFARIYFNRISSNNILQIPVGTKIGPGLYIGHGVCIIVNGGTVIGKNCSISHFVSIGSNKGTPATIGDDVYIGPSVSIVEDVRIGNNVKIGAGTVVVKNIPDNSTSVGNPNRICNQDPERVLCGGVNNCISDLYHIITIISLNENSTYNRYNRPGRVFSRGIAA
ncbi:MAG: hypothetical protein NC453_20035 [Muribaculum sp.]|nr:hypothetical protein [Muribaculum sp.]